MSKRNGISKKLQFYLLSGLFLLIGAVMFLYRITHESIWYGESFTFAITNHSLGQIIQYAIGGCFPPLYYLLLKLFQFLAGNSLLGLRVFSALGALALAALGLGPVKRIWGKKTALIYIFLIITLPMSLIMAQDARMYTWAAFFVTGAVLYGYFAVMEGKRNDWIRFGFFALAAAYTHYFGLVAVFIANIIILVKLLRTNRKGLKSFFITATAVVVLYLPWFLILLRQFRKVNHYYWIEPLTVDLILRTLRFPFSINKFLPIDLYKLDFITLLVAGIFIVWGILKLRAGGATAPTPGAPAKSAKSQLFIFAFMVMVWVITFVFSAMFSRFNKLILAVRYLTPVMGLLALGINFRISQVKQKKLGILKVKAVKSAENQLFIFAFMIYVITFVFTAMFSHFKKPILTERYLTTVMGLLVLGIAFGISQFRQKKLLMIVCIIFLGLNVPSFAYVYQERLNGPMREVVSYLKPQLSPDTVFVHFDERTFGTFCYSFPGNKNFFYLKDRTPQEGDYSVFAPAGSFGPDWNSFLGSHRDIWAVNLMRESGDKSGAALLNSTKFSHKTIRKVFKLPGSSDTVLLEKLKPE